MLLQPGELCLHTTLYPNISSVCEGQPKSVQKPQVQIFLDVSELFLRGTHLLSKIHIIL